MIIWAVLLVIVAHTQVALATIGVGVGSGKIVVNDILKPGSVYELPPITVMNTGDETSEYEMAITYHEQQMELEPAEEWFVFSPKTFKLEPKQTQVVKITLQIPVSLRPGEYFAYLESHPVAVSTNGVTRVGVAAASKLYFTVEPANMLSGIYYRLLTLWQRSQPWGDRFVIAAVVIATVLVFLKYFKVKIDIKPSKRGK